MSTLPLRLWAEGPLKRDFSPNVCFLLPSREEERCCLVISGDAAGMGDGIVCLALSQEGMESDLVGLLGISASDLPRYWIVRNDEAPERPIWYDSREKMKESPTAAMLQSSCKPVGETMATRVVEGINRYYSRQILEPAIRGFLSILGRQFPRNDLYLYELLQNAVDDGAKRIKLVSRNSGVHFCHDGKAFSVTDVLGLASVGLSTKGASGKRTIGFMGIGFKAVYKRYKTVKVFDDTFR